MQISLHKFEILFAKNNGNYYSPSSLLVFILITITFQWIQFPTKEIKEPVF